MTQHRPYEGFDVGPIRPPSEAYSMLLRVSRGCSWNRCKFCGFYRNEKFTVRPVEHIKQDIDQIAHWVAVFQGKAAGEPKTEAENEAYYVALNWFRGGMQTVFLQDGNSLLMRPQQLIEVLNYLNETFPWITHITSYARSDAIARISQEDLEAYAKLKLDRLHVGMETGSDQILKLVNKGVDQKTQILGGQKAVQAGIEVSEFYMPGLGGLEYAQENAKETAAAINQIDPAFVRIRSMSLSDKLDIYADYEAGIFTRGNDIDTVREIRSFIEALDGIDSRVESDHMLNILLELRGKLPEDKPRMLGIIDRFLALPEEMQMVFRMGRRVNAMSSLSDLDNEFQVTQVRNMMRSYGIDQTNIDRISDGLMVNGIPISERSNDE